MKKISIMLLAALMLFAFVACDDTPEVPTATAEEAKLAGDFIDSLDQAKIKTDLGKVMDPFADTLSHLTFFVCFMSRGIMPVWAFIIIMWREFSILFMRMLMMRAGKAMPANIWGKSKTVLYAVASIFSIVYIVVSAFVAEGSWNGIYETGLYVLFALSAVASLLSFITYLSGVLRSGALSGMTR